MDDVSVWFTSGTDDVAVIGSTKAAAAAAAATATNTTPSRKRKTTDPATNDEPTAKRRTTAAAFSHTAGMFTTSNATNVTTDGPRLSQAKFDQAFNLVAEEPPQLASARGAYDHHYALSAPVPQVPGMSPDDARRLRDITVQRVDGQPIQLGPPNQVPPNYGNFTNATIDEFLNRWNVEETRRKFITDVYNQFVTPQAKRDFLDQMEKQWKGLQTEYNLNWTQDRYAALELVRHDPAYNFMTIVAGLLSRPVSFLVHEGSLRTLQPALDARREAQQSMARMVALLQTVRGTYQKAVAEASDVQRRFFETIFVDSGLNVAELASALKDFDAMLATYPKERLLEYYDKGFVSTALFPDIKRIVTSAGPKSTTQGVGINNIREIDQELPQSVKVQLHIVTTIIATGTATTAKTTTKKPMLILQRQIRDSAMVIYDATVDQSLTAVGRFPTTEYAPDPKYPYWLIRPFIPCTQTSDLALTTIVTDSRPRDVVGQTPYFVYISEIISEIGFPNAMWYQTQLSFSDADRQKDEPNFVTWVTANASQTSEFRDPIRAQIVTDAVQLIYSGQNIIHAAAGIASRIPFIFDKRRRALTMTDYNNVGNVNSGFDWPDSLPGALSDIGNIYKLLMSMQASHQISWLVDARFSFMIILVCYHFIRSFLIVIYNSIERHFIALLTDARERLNDAIKKQQQMVEAELKYGPAAVEAQWLWQPENAGKFLFHDRMVAAINEAQACVRRQRGFGKIDAMMIVNDMSDDMADFRHLFARLTAYYLRANLMTDSAAGSYATQQQFKAQQAQFRQLLSELVQYKISYGATDKPYIQRAQNASTFFAM